MLYRELTGGLRQRAAVSKCTSFKIIIASKITWNVFTSKIFESKIVLIVAVLYFLFVELISLLYTVG